LRPITLGPAGQTAKDILAKLKVDTATQLDDLLEKLENHSSTEVIAALFELEMAGLIRQLAGKNFVKAW